MSGEVAHDFPMDHPLPAWARDPVSCLDAKGRNQSTDHLFLGLNLNLTVTF